jgi:hypothetical protein
MGFDRDCAFVGNHSDDLMTVINTDYVYEFANDTYCRYQQKQREEIIGNTVYGMWGYDAFETDIRPHLNQCFLGKTSQRHGWFHFSGPDCGLFEVYYFPYCGDGANVSHAIVITRDRVKVDRVTGRINSLPTGKPQPLPVNMDAVHTVRMGLDPDKAQEYWTQVLKWMPGDRAALFNLGKSLMAQDKAREALLVFQQLRAIDSRYPYVDDLISAAQDLMITSSRPAARGRFLC